MCATGREGLPGEGAASLWPLGAAHRDYFHFAWGMLLKMPCPRDALGCSGLGWFDPCLP
jgi:hypothetical protein